MATGSRRSRRKTRLIPPNWNLRRSPVTRRSRDTRRSPATREKLVTTVKLSYLLDPGYPAFGYQQEPEYPQGPGFAPLPPDYPDRSEPGYPAGTGYAVDPDYAPEQEYPADGWAVPEPRHAGSSGYAEAAYGPEAGTVPPTAPRPRAAAQPLARPSPGWMPSAAAGPPGAAQTPDSLTAEALLHGKRPASGSGWRAPNLPGDRRPAAAG